MFFPERESQRLELLHQYHILDTPPEEAFDDLVQLAIDICKTSIALISLVDSQREWFKAKVGIMQGEIPRNICFGIYTILENEILIVPDTWQDERFVENLLVRDQPYFRFYAGVPLINTHGFALGSLAVMDLVPRHLSLQEQTSLKRLARQGMRLLELHREQINHKKRLNANFPLRLDTCWINTRVPDEQIMSLGKEITDRQETEGVLKSLKHEVERERLMGSVAQRIRQSLNLQDILDATVTEIKGLLKVERVIVYKFTPGMKGKIVAESVEPGWKIALDTEIEDTCFQTGAGADYRHGYKRAIANIYDAGLSDCHLNLLEQFQVKANLVVSILLEINQGNTVPYLWGLLIAHQCSSQRQWEEYELDLLDQLSVPIAIAIQQNSILQQAQNQLAERQKVEIQLRSALAEKEVLLKEVHHRVKNNLQMVSGLLLLHSQTLKDPELIRTLKESQNRVESISLIHKNLYTSPNIGQINVLEYINNLAASILTSYQIAPGKISLKTNINAVELNVDQAIACGLIINELLTNSLKHAFPEQQKGKININLQKVGQNIEMTVKDNGIGLPDNLDWDCTDSLGLSLVYDLVIEQLEGTISVENQPGSVFRIQFPY